MSAISGIFYRDGRSVKFEEINNLNDSMSHRGPDKSSIWMDHSVAFGHQMMCTTEESLHEKLPFFDKKTGLSITSDARIDNREELSRKLNIQNNQNVSDSYYILKSYEKWGEKCPEYLLGDFSFVIWDNNQKKMFCARDHMGVKPFYYFLTDEIFIFSTEFNAFKKIKEVPTVLNQERVYDYLIPFNEDRENTFYKSIKRLPAATLIIVNLDTSYKKIYWKLNVENEITMDSNDDYAKKFLEIFTESVRCRMRTISDLGSMLSGGLDSSSIVSVVCELLEKENSDYFLKTFSAIFPTQEFCDESEYIHEIIKTKRIEPYLIYADKLSPLSQIGPLLELVGEPFDVPNLYLHNEFYKEANKNGVNVILDGFDGDTTVFYGEKYYLDLLQEGDYVKLYDELVLFSKYENSNIFLIILIYILLPLTPELMKNIAQIFLDGFKSDISLTDKNLFELLNKNFISKPPLKNRFEKLYKNLSSKATTNKSCHHMHLSSGTFQYVLEVADVTAANNSVEPRYPFFDKRLMEFCLALPKEQKFCGIYDRIVMRRAMENILPSKIQYRSSKGALGINFKKNMLEYDIETLEKSFQDIDLIGEYVNTKYLKEIFKKYKLGEEHVEPFDIWLSINLIIWLKKLELKN